MHFFYFEVVCQKSFRWLTWNIFDTEVRTWDKFQSTNLPASLLERPPGANLFLVVKDTIINGARQCNENGSSVGRWCSVVWPLAPSTSRYWVTTWARWSTCWWRASRTTANTSSSAAPPSSCGCRAISCSSKWSTRPRCSRSSTTASRCVISWWFLHGLTIYKSQKVQTKAAHEL